MSHVHRSALRLLPVLLSAVILGVGSSAYGFSAGIPSNQFGAGGCNSCHSGGMTPTVTLTGPTSVSTNSTNVYTLQIMAAPAQNEGGLNVAVTEGTLAMGGSSFSDTQVILGTGGLAEITHTMPKPASGGAVTFSFQWTAPSAPTTITMNAWGNAVNGDHGVSGDMAALRSMDIDVTADATPTPTPLCAPTPAAGCRKVTKSGASTVQLKENANPSKNSLVWNWNKGEATTIADFGDPLTGSTSYTLCMYDESASVPSAVVQAMVPHGGTCAGKPCWKATKTGFTYQDKTLSNDGVQQIVLKQGVAGKAAITVKGNGTNFPVPAPVGAGLLAQDPAVILQLTNSSGVCWEADYSAPATKNIPAQFKDKSD